MPKTARTACMLLMGGALLLVAPMAHAGSAGKHHGDSSVSVIMAKAQRGDAHAQALLGFLYANGRDVPQSYDRAVEWYMRSASQGDPDGQYLLGLAYDKGLGITADVVEAHKWLILAASHAPSHSRENFLRMRDAIGSKMTPEQIDLAQKLALDFVPRP